MKGETYFINIACSSGACVEQPETLVIDVSVSASKQLKHGFMHLQAILRA